MRFEHVNIFTEDGEFRTASVEIGDGKITEINFLSSNEEDTKKYPYLIPGFIDLHFHGCKGSDFSDGTVEAIEVLAEYEASVGVTSICPATMSVSAEDLRSIMQAAHEYSRVSHDKSSHLVGINMEGPFINPDKKGAQNAKNIIPCDLSLFNELQKMSGNLIKLVDLAPEMQGALNFIRELKSQSTISDTVVSIAHTNANYDITKEAIEAGASHVTHLYNAMPSLMHRDPGVIGAAWESPDCKVELIADGIHIHPVMIQATFTLFGEDRVILISDSMRAAGLEDGSYTLGGQDVLVEGKRATLSDGTIAGSVTNLMDCFLYAVREAGIPLLSALKAVTINPAKELGIFDSCGSVTVGKQADLILMSPSLEVMEIYLGK